MSSWAAACLETASATHSMFAKEIGAHVAGLIVGIVVVVVVGLIALALALHIVKQYEKGVVFRFGRVVGEKAARARRDRAVRQRAAPGLACGS